MQMFPCTLFPHRIKFWEVPICHNLFVNLALLLSVADPETSERGGGGGKEYEIYAEKFDDHLFYDYFHRTGGGGG